MAMQSYIPERLSALTPMLAVRNADKAIEWYKKVLNATEVSRLTDHDGKVAHAELEISGCMLMLAEEHPDYNKSPESLHGTPVILNLYVPNVDTTVERALKEGAALIFPVEDQFYGDRAGRIQDPFGHMWIISKHIKDVSPKEMQAQIEREN
ncbi:MAG TPA: VOC family protein [Chryseolinea sp.]